MFTEIPRRELQVLKTLKISELTNISERNAWVEVAGKQSVTETLKSLSTTCAVRRVVVKDTGNAGYQGILSQFDALKWILRQVTNKQWFAQTRFLSIVPPNVHPSNQVHSITCTASASDGFTKMAEVGVSGLAVVDEKGVLVSCLSGSDFLRIRGDYQTDWSAFFADLNEPISNYLTHRSFYFPGKFSKDPVILKSSDTVIDVLRKMIDRHIHRLFQVDKDGHPIGVWSCSDIISVFLKYQGVQQQKAAEKKKDQSKNKSSKKNKSNKKDKSKKNKK